MARNHKIFVRRDGPCGSLAPGNRDPRVAAGVRRFIEVYTEPGPLLTHAAMNFGGVLADARGEDQRVQPAEGGGERSQLPADSIDKQGDGVGRVRIVARQQGPHVITDAGDTEEPGFVIEKVANLTRRHTLLLHQVENDAGSRVPHRRLMGRPSSAVKPMVVATLLRRCIAHVLAPLPRWATTTRPSASAGPRMSGRTLAMYS